MAKVNISFYLDTRRPLKCMQIPVKLQVNYRREQKFYSIGVNVFKEDFEKVMGPNPKGEHKEIQMKLFAIQARANKIAEKMSLFSFPTFERKMFAKVTSDELDVLFGFEEYIEHLKRQNRFGTARSYDCAMRSFRAFSPRLHYPDVTPEFLRDYERFMLEQKKSISTVGIYTRSLRTIYNKAISDGIIPSDLYPFGKYRYKTPTARNIKKALSLQDIKKIYDCAPDPGTSLERSRDLWLFSYLANGMNPKDIATLRYSDIQDRMILFHRQKTIRTERTRQPIVVYITDDIDRIIKKWGNPPTLPDSYIFPIVTDEMDGEKKEKVIQQFIQVTNAHMDTISKQLGITRKVRFSSARHSFATILKRGGASNKIIGEALGQQSEAITERYLDSFDDEIKREWAKILTKF